MRWSMPATRCMWIRRSRMAGNTRTTPWLPWHRRRARSIAPATSASFRSACRQHRCAACTLWPASWAWLWSPSWQSLASCCRCSRCWRQSAPRRASARRKACSRSLEWSGSPWTPSARLPPGTGETVGGDPPGPHSCDSRIASCATWLRRPHRGDSILVDLDHVAPGVCSTREASEACRSPRDDRMGVGAGLDHVTLFDLLVEEGGEAIPARP